MSLVKELISKSDFTSVLVLFFLFVITGFYFYISTHNEIVGLVADDAVYLLMTDYFSPYYQSLSDSAAFVMKTSQFPPMYPIFLSVFGATSQKIIWAHVITTCCLIGASLIYNYWLRLEKVNKHVRLCLILLFLCSPASFLMNIDIWSEHLYLLLTFCSLYYLKKAEDDKSFQLVAALLIGVMPLVRIIGLSFVVAYFIYLNINKIKAKYKYIAVSILPYIIWEIISFNFFQSDIYQGTLADFYNHSIWLHIIHLFTSQLFDLWQGWHECFDIRRNQFSGIVSGVILVLSVVTLFLRLAEKKIDSLYILFYLLVIWVWPDDNHNMRFMFVIFPILLFYAYLAFHMIFKIKLSTQIKTMISTTGVLVVLIVFLPTNIYALNRLSIDTEVGLESFKISKFWLTVKNRKEGNDSVRIIDKMISSYSQAGLYIPANECAYTVHQEQFMFYARKLAFPLPLPQEIVKGGIMDNLSRCSYIHVLHASSHPEYPGGYPLEMLKNNFSYTMSTKMTEEADSPVVAELIKLHEN